MNDKNDDLNKTNHYSLLAPDNDDEKLLIKDQFLKINNLIKINFIYQNLTKILKTNF